jgi:hypothetical protein
MNVGRSQSQINDYSIQADQGANDTQTRNNQMPSKSLSSVKYH